MKEAFWGALIVILGLFGIVVINIFQNVTVDNDRVYYLIKESTEAAAFDALDLTYYRLTGDLRIVEDKFVENLTRRFAENVTAGDYIIVVEDINEVPPKVSLRIRSGVTSLQGQEFGIVNRVDGILETKYGLDEVLDFLDITKEEWEKEITKEEEGDENICDLGGLEKEDMECIPGDLMFSGFGDENINDTVCDDEQDKLPKNVQREARYKVCNCGKWEEKSEVVTANPVKNGNEWIYTWTFTKVGDLRTITETARKRVLVQICTKAIGVMVPNDIEKTVPKKDGTSYEPSTDNSKYMACPVDGIRIPYGMKFTLHPNYIPPESVNRDIKWTVSDSSILSIQSSNPLKSCELNSKGTNCYSKAIVTANTQKEGTVIVNISNTRGQSATCKIEVFDGTIDDVSCKDISVKVNSSEIISYEYMPKNATNYDFEFTISDSSMATVSGNKITGKKNGTTTITVKDKVTGKSGTCKAMIYSEVTGSSSGGSSGGGGYILVQNSNGETKAFYNYDQAVEYAKTASKVGETTNIYNVSSSGETYKDSTMVQTMASGSSETYLQTKTDGSTIKTTDNQSGVTKTTTVPGKDPVSEYTPHKSTSSSSSSSNHDNSAYWTGGGGSGKAPTPAPAPAPKPAPAPAPKPAPAPAPAPSTGGGGGGCLAEGTKIKLSNGKYKNIEDITYNDLLEVWNYETGSYTYEYPIWIENEKTAPQYTNIEFSDGTSLKVVMEHGIYDLDKNMFVNIEDLKIGSKVAKIVDGNIQEVFVTKINKVNEAVKYYHIVSTRYYNVIANDILTTDYIVLLSNFRGFNNDLTWKTKKYSQAELYSYNELSYLPYYLFKGFRAEEAKAFENVLDKEAFKDVMTKIILSPNRLTKPNTNLLGNRMWMVTTSDDKLNLVNEFKYLKEEGSKYKIPYPRESSKFKNWYNTADGKSYNPGDLIEVNTGTHLIAVYN